MAKKEYTRLCNESISVGLNYGDYNQDECNESNTER